MFLPALVAPSVAAANPALSVGASCLVGYERGDYDPPFVPSPTYPLEGTGFAASSNLIVLLFRPDNGEVPAEFPVTTDVAGSFTTTIGVGEVDSRFISQVHLEARPDRQGAALAAIDVPFVGRYVNRHGNKPFFSARGRKEFTLIGFPNATVYSHILYSRAPPHKTRFHYRKTRKIGRAAGPCGGLTVRRRPLDPVKRPAVGYWLAQYDDSRHYSAKTPGRVVICYTSTAPRGSVLSGDECPSLN